jgi:hypothetical protein
MKALFINKTDLVKNTAISGSMDLDKLIHFIKIAQDIHVQTVLGTNLYDKLQDDIVANTLTGHYATLVETYIKPTLVQWSFMEFLPFAAYTVGSKGVFKKTSENGENPEPSEIDKMKEATRDIANHYSMRLVDHLRHHAHDRYPEYIQTTEDDDMRPNRNMTFGGWEL